MQPSGPGGVLFPSWAAHLDGKSSPAVPPSELLLLSGDKSLLVGVGSGGTILWAQGRFHSSGPTLLSQSPWALGLARRDVGLGGTWDVDTALKRVGASRAREKYQQHEASSSSLSPESEGRGWRDPGLAALV